MYVSSTAVLTDLCEFFLTQGLVQSKQIMKSSSITQAKATSVTSPKDMENECLTEHGEETCPVCQEKLTNRKMVFQCGHVTCCKCEFPNISFILTFS